MSTTYEPYPGTRLPSDDGFTLCCRETRFCREQNAHESTVDPISLFACDFSTRSEDPNRQRGARCLSINMILHTYGLVPLPTLSFQY